MLSWMCWGISINSSMTICFIILGHRAPEHVVTIARQLLSAKQPVVIHYDAKSPGSDFSTLKKLLAGHSQVYFTNRVPVEWGTWSIVNATLNALETIRVNRIQPDYVYLLSGSDYPIRPISELIQFLDRNNGHEFIENWPADIFKWVVVDKQRERYLYRHYINSKKHYYLFTFIYLFQRLLRLKRRFVNGYTPYIGSQWWALTWPTCQKVLALLDSDPKITRFFKGVHVPDELFFQTLVNTVVPKEKIKNKKLTLCEFDDFGVAVTYESKHFNYVISQPFYFARKIMPEAKGVIERLDDIVLGRLNCPSFKDKEIGIKNKTIKDFYL